MRFFKVVKPKYGLKEGDNILFSDYLWGVTLLSDGVNKTKYRVTSKSEGLELILNDYVTPMSDSEVRKLIPYLPKMVLKFDYPLFY